MEAGESIPSETPRGIVVLPYITVQHDLQDVIQDVSDGTIGAEPFWVSVYREGSPSVHGKVLVKASLEHENQAVLEAQGDIEFERQTSSSYTVACSRLDVPPTSVKMPKQLLKSLISKGIDSMDVSPNGHLYIVGGHDGALRIGNVRTDSPEDIRLLKGHVGDILSCRFFPSAEVVISTSSDLTARIFSALDGSNPRTFQGHTAAVTDAAIIERGRHVLTTSNDGTLKLWLVGEAKCLKTWRFGYGNKKRALKVVVFTKEQLTQATESTLDTEVANKAAAITLEDGTVAIVDLAASAADPPAQTIRASQQGKALTALAVTKVDDDALVASGSADGVVSIISINSSNLSEPAKTLLQFKRNDADVTSLTFNTPDGAPAEKSVVTLLAASMDGLLYESEITIDKNEATVKVIAEYAGYDIDACNAIVQRKSETYAGGKDGHLRRY